MEFDLWRVDNDIHGRLREYLLHPDFSDRRFVQAKPLCEPDNTHGVSVEIPDTSDLIDRTGSELVYIHTLEARETIRRKAVRKVIDWGLSGQGTIITGVACGLGVYERTRSVFPSIALGVGGIWGHEMLRRPFVGARHFVHQIKNPWSPAAQSTARIRKAILET